MTDFQATIDKDFLGISLYLYTRYKGEAWSSIQIRDEQKEIPILINVLTNRLAKISKEKRI